MPLIKDHLNLVESIIVMNLLYNTRQGLMVPLMHHDLRDL